ncbi:peptidase inhibitor family I36 protein [Saccharomonospora amisosensis]|nr:peptidase inhibitor family I36 protein [Saccharomonospora amisosensis]
MHGYLAFLRTWLPGVLVLTTLLLSGSTAANAVQPPNPSPSAAHSCQKGEFCSWPEADYGGAITRFDLRNTNPEECVPFPDGFEANAFANRIDRHVTVYQDRECSTEADFSTYPGPETFVPRSPYIVRAIQIWN